MFTKFLTTWLTRELCKPLDVVGLVDSNQLSSTLHNSQVNLGVKKLVNKAHSVVLKDDAIKLTVELIKMKNMKKNFLIAQD